MQQRKNDTQTEFILYRNGPAYPAGLSGHVCVWKNILVRKDKAKYCSTKFVGSCFHPIG
jgi:hypothetical protein